MHNYLNDLAEPKAFFAYVYDFPHFYNPSFPYFAPFFLRSSLLCVIGSLFLMMNILPKKGKGGCNNNNINIKEKENLERGIGRRITGF